MRSSNPTPHRLVIITEGEAAILEAHRAAAGHDAPADLPVDAYQAFLSTLMDMYLDAATKHLVSQAGIRAQLTLVDRMVQLQKTA